MEPRIEENESLYNQRELAKAKYLSRLKKKFEVYTASIHHTLQEIVSIWLKYNSETNSMIEIDHKMWTPFVDFTSMINLAFKCLSNALYNNSKSRINFKEDLYNVLADVRDTRLEFIQETMEGVKYIEPDIMRAKTAPSKKEIRSMRLGTIQKSLIALIESQTQMDGSGKSIEGTLARLKNIQTVFDNKENSAYIGQRNSDNEKEGFGVFINMQSDQKNVRISQHIAAKSWVYNWDVDLPKLNLKTSDKAMLYFGLFSNDNFHGYGTHIDLEGNRYEGDWEDGLKHGHGKLHYHSFNITFEGYFERGEFHGFGKFTNHEKKVFCGLWYRGKLKIKDLDPAYLDGNGLVYDFDSDVDIERKNLIASRFLNMSQAPRTDALRPGTNFNKLTPMEKSIMLNGRAMVGENDDESQGSSYNNWQHQSSLYVPKPPAKSALQNSTKKPKKFTIEDLQRGFAVVHFISQDPKDPRRWEYIGNWSEFKMNSNSVGGFMRNDEGEYWNGTWIRGEREGIMEFKEHTEGYFKSDFTRYGIFYKDQLKFDNIIINEAQINKLSRRDILQFQRGKNKVTFRSNKNYDTRLGQNPPPVKFRQLMYDGNWREFMFEGVGLLTDCVEQIEYQANFHHGKMHGVCYRRKKGWVTAQLLIYYNDKIAIDGFSADFMPGSDFFNNITKGALGGASGGEAVKEPKLGENGFEEVTYGDGMVYRGFWKKCQYHGRGLLTYADGRRFEGFFYEGKRQGVGSQTYPDKQVVHGIWVADKLVQQYIDPDQQKKIEIEDLKTGFDVKLAYVEGFEYQGDWDDYKKEGYGELRSDIFEYKGSWDVDKIHGFGDLKFKVDDIDLEKPVSDVFNSFIDVRGCSKFQKQLLNKLIVSGRDSHVLFQRGRPCQIGLDKNFNEMEDLEKGAGVMYFENGDLYKGEFNLAYQFHGTGIMEFANEDFYMGGWYQNQMHGLGKMRKGDAFFTGRWRNGEPGAGMREEEYDPDKHTPTAELFSVELGQIEEDDIVNDTGGVTGENNTTTNNNTQNDGADAENEQQMNKKDSKVTFAGIESVEQREEKKKVISAFGSKLINSIQEAGRGSSSPNKNSLASLLKLSKQKESRLMKDKEVLQQNQGLPGTFTSAFTAKKKEMSTEDIMKMVRAKQTMRRFREARNQFKASGQKKRKSRALGGRRHTMLRLQNSAMMKPLMDLFESDEPSTDGQSTKPKNIAEKQKELRRRRTQALSKKTSTLLGDQSKEAMETLQSILLPKYQDKQFLKKLFNGEQKVEYINGDIYEGSWRRYKKAGYGTYTWASTGAVYKGSFKEDLMEGYGELTYTVLTKKVVDNKIIEEKETKRKFGLWSDSMLKVSFAKKGQRSFDLADLKIGQYALVEFEDCEEVEYLQYEGTWFNFKKEGFGKESNLANRIYYEGDFKNGKRHGYGSLKEYNKTQRDSFWANGLQILPASKHRHGADFAQLREDIEMGRRVNICYEKGGRYEGTMANYNRSGAGIMYYLNSGKHDGAWDDDNRHGFGRYTFMRRTIFGIWVHDVQVQWLDEAEETSPKVKAWREKKELFSRMLNRHGDAIALFKLFQQMSIREAYAVKEKKKIDLERNFNELIKILLRIEREKKEEIVRRRNGEFYSEDSWNSYLQMLQNRFRGESSMVSIMKKTSHQESQFSIYKALSPENSELNLQMPRSIRNMPKPKKGGKNQKKFKKSDLENQESLLEKGKDFKLCGSELGLEKEALRHSSQERVQENTQQSSKGLNRELINDSTIFLEAIMDGNLSVFSTIFSLLFGPNRGKKKHYREVSKIFAYKDSNERNALHLACYYGQGLTLMYLLTITKLLMDKDFDADPEANSAKITPSLKKSKKRLKKQKKKLSGAELMKFQREEIKRATRAKFKAPQKRRLKRSKKFVAMLNAKDIDGNTPFDLACIHGFSDLDSDIVTFRLNDLKFIKNVFDDLDNESISFLRKDGDNMHPDSFMDDIKLIHDRFDTFLSFSSKENSLRRAYGVNPYSSESSQQSTDSSEDSQIDSLINPPDEVVTKGKFRLINLEGGSKKDTKFPISTKRLKFVSTRAFCVKILIEFVNNLEKNGLNFLGDDLLIRKGDYLNRTCPLHWGFYWSDFHMIISLLEYNMDMIFWKNEEDQFPSQMITRTVDEAKSNNSMIVSILN